MYQTRAKSKPSPSRKRRPQQWWSYNGVRVSIAPSAEIFPGFRPHERYGKHVQEFLDEMEPWEPSNDPLSETADSLFELPAIIALNNGRKPVWGIHTRHTARNPGLSPFLHGSGEIQMTRELTVELVGTITQPRIIRVYPGDYMPSLPWQVSAESEEGGKATSIHFWRNHSFIYDPSVIQDRKHTSRAPEWYR